MARTGRPVGSTCTLCGVSAGRERMIALRIALHGSQRSLASALAAAGVHATARAISGWERGEYHPEESKLSAIARALRVRSCDLEAWLWPTWGREQQAELRMPGASSSRPNQTAPRASAAAN